MYRIGIVGAGSIAKCHSEAIMKNADCELVAVADVVYEKAADIANVHGAKIYTDYKVMCNDIKMDAVIINLPHFLHCEATVYFLEHKINVLIEKPMAMTTKECDIMINAANVNNVKLGVGHVQQYIPAYDIVREAVKSGKYGRLCRITEIRNINYLQNRPKWFLDKKLAGGGIVFNYCAHTLDKIFYTTGLNVEGVNSVISNFLSDDNIESGAQILLELTGGISAGITYCGCNVPNNYETVFYFTDGVIKIVNGEDLWVFENGEFKNYPEVSADMFGSQINELVKFLNGENSKIATAEYSKKIVDIINKILDTKCYR